jgi:two-component system sensor histidine kinase CreC
VIESKEPLTSKKNLSVAVEATGDLWVRGDPFLLHQAVSNLIQNAIDFSPAGSPIEIAATADGDRLDVVVRDHGPGIPDYAKEKVFDKFFSLQRPDTGKKSTGLGLNFVKEVALLHHGEIRLENLPDGGLWARLSLPA